MEMLTITINQLIFKVFKGVHYRETTHDGLYAVLFEEQEIW